jgi:hypothetical protein
MPYNRLPCAALVSAAAYLVAAFAALAGGSAVSRAAGAGEPSGLMAHVPLDGSFNDKRAIGAMRAEAQGDPAFVAGAVGRGAIPESGHAVVGLLYVTRLSRILLLGRTPAAGTIMLWFRLPSPVAASADTPPDTLPAVILSSDAPLNLTVEVDGSRLTAGFDDEEGIRHQIEVPIRSPDRWTHIARGWDSQEGNTIAFLKGEPIARGIDAAFRMPRLPRVFALGAPEIAIDDFRLYNRHLEPAEIRALPGIGEER